MKRAFFRASGIGIAALPLLMGCVERRVVYVPSPPPPAPTSPVVVNEPPPTPPQEVIVASPGPEYVWVPGYYSWTGRWVWIRGSWVVRPHPHALWVAGHWAHRGHGYIWIGGHGR